MKIETVFGKITDAAEMPLLADDNKQKIVANFDSSNKRKTLLYHTIF